MEKSTVESILSSLKGVTKKKNTFTVSPEARVYLLLKFGLRPLALESITLTDEYLSGREGDGGDDTFIDYDAIAGLTSKAPEKGIRRPGF